MNHILVKQLLFIDIETVPASPHFNQLSKPQQKLWADKVNRYQNENIDVVDLYKKKAGILAEFGQIICIAVGFITGKKDNYKMRIKAFSSKNEKEVLIPFIQLLNQSFQNIHQFYFCGHNIKEFDIPYICRRIIINGLNLPNSLNLSGLKPWEVNHIDTLDLWKFGDRKHYTSLNLLAHILNIPTPKDDIDGKDVARVFWEENDLKRIATYCKKDVATVAQVMMRFKQQPLLKKEEIFMV